jgi:hypothetical protein
MPTILTWPSRFTHFANKSIGIFRHQPVRQPQHTDADFSEEGLLRRALSCLAGLRVHASVQLDSQALFAAVEIDNIIFDRVLASEFQAQAPIAQQMPGSLFGLGLRVARFADALGADSHSGSNPSPAPALRGPSPLVEGCEIKFPQHRAHYSACDLAKREALSAPGHPVNKFITRSKGRGWPRIAAG